LLLSSAKNREKSGFFSNLSKLERFLWELSPIEEYNRKPVHRTDVPDTGSPDRHDFDQAGYPWAAPLTG
jgi:hypothetical protein